MPDIAEVPGCIWVPAHPNRYHGRPANALTPYSLVVVHITSGHPDIMGVGQMWQGAPSPAGSIGTAAHFGVGADGKVIQAVKLRYAANHAHAANAYSVGIEHAAREPNEPSFPKGDPGLQPTMELYNASAKLVAYLLKAAGLQPVKGLTIMGHAAADPVTTHTGCPDAAGWNWPLYMQLVGDAFRALSGAPPPAVT